MKIERMPPVKVAIIGAGSMGRRHIQVVREMGMRLVGVCDVKAEALALAVREQQITAEQQYADANSLLTNTRPECVIIATTAPTHCEYTCRAVECGAKFVLCEKPMAVSLSECERMIACCREAGVSLAINHPRRFIERYTVPKSLLQTDEYGGLSSISVIAGNFGVAMNGSHYFEMLRFMTDDSPATVSAWFSPDNVPNPRGPQFFDKAGAVRVTTKTGKRFYMDASSDQGHGLLITYAARNGMIVVDELTGEMKTTVRKAEHRALPTTRYGMPFQEAVSKIAPADVIAPTKAVLKALLAGKGYPNGEDGRNAVEVLVAAYVSAESGNRVVYLGEERLPMERRFPWA